MENTIFQNHRIFNYIYNDSHSKTKKEKDLEKKKDIDEVEPKHPAIKYPKDSKIENLKKNMKFKEEDSPLYVNYRKSDMTRQAHKKKNKHNKRPASVDVQHINMLNNIMF